MFLVQKYLGFGAKLGVFTTKLGISNVPKLGQKSRNRDRIGIGFRRTGRFSGAFVRHARIFF